MFNIENIIRSDLLNFVPYRSARDEEKTGTIWLNANESPFDQDNKINRYPKKQDINLLNLLSERFNTRTDQLMLTRGSDEAIDLLIRLCCTPKEDSILMCSPTYGMYAVYAALQNVNVMDVPLCKDTFQLDFEKIISCSIHSRIKLIFLCSPNNPTGNTIGKEMMLTLCAVFKNALIVVDEAYIDFSDQPSLSSWIDSFPNLVILRTLSKAYGLAGARVGAFIANSQLIEWALKIMAPYPLSSLVTEYVCNIVKNKWNIIQHDIVRVKNERARLINSLKSFSFIEKIWDSEANFILIQSKSSALIFKTCRENGIILRNMSDKTNLNNCLRITVGRYEENNALINALGCLA